MSKPMKQAKLIGAAMLSLCLAVTPVAIAQPTDSSGKKVEPLKPPIPPATNNSTAPIMPKLIGAVLAAVAVGVAFIPSKRGHQD